MMTAKQLAEKATYIAKTYKTVYMWGTFGQPVTDSIINSKTNQYPSWYNATRRTAFRKLVDKGYFAFDCVGLIKGILWGWNAKASSSNGGAKYASNGVPDKSADGTIAICKNVTTNWSTIEIGEAVWCSGHIGIYIGDGLAVECTPSWKNCVQITAVGNIGKKSGYNTRKWTKHGKLPYVTYTGVNDLAKPTTPPAENKPATGSTAAKTAVDAAKSFDKSLAKTYTVTASALNMRKGAGTTKGIIKTLKMGEKVTCYGYFTKNGSTIWLFVSDQDGNTGFVSKKYLK